MEDSTRRFGWYPQLLALCCLAHFSVHLPRFQASSASWWLAVAVLIASGLTLVRPSMPRFLTLCGLQVGHTLVDAPFNPDHWLLLFFVNLLTLGSAAWLGWREGVVRHDALFERFVPSARLAFLICYGSAAFAKFNVQFLNPEDSCASVLMDYQVGALPALSWIIWRPAVAWLTALFEAALPICLCIRPLRNLGIMIGLFFHGMIVASPAVMVFDFTIVVYAMLYLFTPECFDERLSERLQRIYAVGPQLWDGLRRWFVYALLAGVTVIVATSLGGTSLMEVTTRFVVRRWYLSTGIALALFVLTGSTLFSPIVPGARLGWLPRTVFQYAVLGMAICNALCPYMGLKTQGSFTMFSNLRTEAGEWNHYLLPRQMRVVSQYQDALVKIVDTSNPQLKAKYVEPGYLTPLFEVRRCAMQDPDMSLTVWQDGRRFTIDKVADDPQYGQPLSWLERKTLIFRPVTPDSSPYCGN